MVTLGFSSEKYANVICERSLLSFSHPTLYVFPGGQGDSALFGINGFNLLVDGGFSKKATFWDFSRHLDRLDAILITRISDDNAGGMSALLQRKTMSATYPQIGHVFANLPHSEKFNEVGQTDKGMYCIYGRKKII